MSLESASFISGLIASNPTSNDNVGDGDNHIRLVKNVLKLTFPNIGGEVSPTHTQINTGISLANTATDANTGNAIVKRNASGNFSANVINANSINTGNITITGTVTGSLTGNANSATSAAIAAQANKWTTPRTLNLGGDVTGSVSIDGSQDATLTATVVGNSHFHEIGTLKGRGTRMLEADLDAIENAVTGAAVLSAGKWTTERRISFSGDIQGSGAFDGSSNFTIPIAVRDNSHEHQINTIFMDGNGNTLEDALNAKLGPTSTAAKATQLATARNIQVTGAVSGDAYFDGLRNIEIATVSNISTGNVSGLAAALAAATLAAWPVGSIMSTTTSTAPAIGGTWVAYGAGRVLIGKSISGEFSVGGSTGGSATTTLAVTNLPAHSHNFQRENPSGTGFAPGSADGASSEYTSSTATTGDGTPFSNVQPYVVVYMWKRTG